MKFTVLGFLLFMGADTSSCDKTSPPNEHDCVEFDRATVHNGRAVNCRMLWCRDGITNTAVGGPATLWCDELQHGQ